MKSKRTIRPRLVLPGREVVMTAATIEDTEAGDVGALTDGIHLVVDALRVASGG